MIQIIKSVAFLILAAFMSLRSWTQDKGLDVNINVNKKNSLWYKQPWVWVAGAAVFVLLLVALLRRNGKKE